MALPLGSLSGGREEAVINGPLSIDWTARIEKITQLDRTFVRIERA